MQSLQIEKNYANRVHDFLLEIFNLLIERSRVFCRKFLIITFEKKQEKKNTTIYV